MGRSKEYNKCNNKGRTTRRLLASLVFTLLLAVLITTTACSKEYVCADGTVVDDTAKCQNKTEENQAEPSQNGETDTSPDASENDGGEDQEPAEPKVTMPEEIQEKLGNREKVESYKFLRAKLPDAKADHTYFVKGDRVKIKLMKPRVYKKDVYYDTVYINRNSKEAKGYCEEPRRCPGDGKEFDLEYSEFMDFKLPDERADSIPPTAEVKNTATVDGKTALNIRYEKDGKHYQVSLYQFFGLPLEVKIYSDSKYRDLVGGYEFRDFGVNGLTKEDFVPDPHTRD